MQIGGARCSQMGTPWEHEPGKLVVERSCIPQSQGIRIMASIEKRTSKVGRTITWRVKWRTGGTRDGAWDGETCDDLKTARRFKALVEAAGEQRPDGYPRGCRGNRITIAVASDA